MGQGDSSSRHIQTKSKSIETYLGPSQMWQLWVPHREWFSRSVGVTKEWRFVRRKDQKGWWGNTRKPWIHIKNCFQILNYLIGDHIRFVTFGRRVLSCFLLLVSSTYFFSGVLWFLPSWGCTLYKFVWIGEKIDGFSGWVVKRYCVPQSYTSNLRWSAFQLLAPDPNSHLKHVSTSSGLSIPN